MQETFETLANHRGLVPMRITTGDFAPYQRDSVAGFPPDEAARLYGRKAAVPIDAKGNEIAVKVEVKPEPKVLTAGTVKAEVEIPKEWATLHHFKRIRLAKEIRGDNAALTADTADEIIRAELAKRGVS